MMYCKGRITKLLVDYFEDDYKRIEHALEVLREAEVIMLDYPNYDKDLIIATALLHDVGIKKSESILGYNNGKTQEEYGPQIAEELLLSIDFPRDKIVKAKEIIGNHHSPSLYNYPELEILKKADYLINSSS